MNAPDKIYILPMQNQADGCVGVAWRDKHGKMTEYIRKDFLLHILAKKKVKVGIGLSKYDMGKENGKYQVLNELIEEIKVL